MITFDGLVFKADGWNPLFEASGLNAVHVTVADFLTDYEGTLDGIAAWHRLARRDRKSMFVLRDVEDLERIGREERLGVLFGLQNAQPVAEDLSRLERLWALGVRVIQITYNEANLLGDGCVEDRDAGLSRLGREFVRVSGELGFLIDLSHVGTRSALEALELSDRPMAITHANLSRLTPNPRNKTDEVFRAVAERGGIVGATTYGPLLWDGRKPPAIADFVRQVHAMLDLVGEDAVTVGTDFPSVIGDGLAEVADRSLQLFPEIFGAFTAAHGDEIEQRYSPDLPSIANWPSIPAALIASGLTEETTAKVVGGNWVRFLSALWAADAQRASAA